MLMLQARCPEDMEALQNLQETMKPELIRFLQADNNSDPDCLTYLSIGVTSAHRMGKVEQHIVLGWAIAHYCFRVRCKYPEPYYGPLYADEEIFILLAASIDSRQQALDESLLTAATYLADRHHDEPPRSFFQGVVRWLGLSAPPRTAEEYHHELHTFASQQPWPSCNITMRDVLVLTGH